MALTVFIVFMVFIFTQQTFTSNSVNTLTRRLKLPRRQDACLFAFAVDRSQVTFAHITTTTLPDVLRPKDHVSRHSLASPLTHLLAGLPGVVEDSVVPFGKNPVLYPIIIHIPSAGVESVA